MTVEQLNVYIQKYRDKASYFKNIEFDSLSADFEEMATVLEIVKYLLTPDEPSHDSDTSEIRNS